MKELKRIEAIPTADLLSEMESVEIVGGLLDGDITGNYILARCPNPTYSGCNIYCDGGNCVANCNCLPSKDEGGNGKDPAIP